MKNKITYFGSAKDVKEAITLIGAMLPHLSRMKEANARLKLQELIDEHPLKANILLNGNVVWGKKKILRNLDRIIKHGVLYNEDQKKPPILSQYFYDFLHLVCGSVAHYDIHGWLHKYPTVDHLKKFFKKNEWGKPVRDWIPPRFTDAIEVVKAIEKKLLPFQTYMKMREEEK